MAYYTFIEFQIFAASLSASASTSAGGLFGYLVLTPKPFHFSYHIFAYALASKADSNPFLLKLETICEIKLSKLIKDQMLYIN
jgi:hypothetical protein